MKILPKKKQVLIKNLRNNSEFYEQYDKLVIATGARPFVPEIKGLDTIENVFTLRTLTDAKIIKSKLLEIEKALIIGGNYIGI